MLDSTFGGDSMKPYNRGQMRIVEAMIASIILITGIATTSYFSSVFTVKEGGDLEEDGRRVLHVLDNTDLISEVVENRGNWRSKLKNLLATLLPVDTYYSLTIFSELTGQPIGEAITNAEGQNLSSSLDAISLQQIITISVPAARIEERDLDVILAIDRSGSMSDIEPGDDYSKFYYAQEAAKAFVDQLNASRDRVGVVSFSGDDDQYSDDDAMLDSPLTGDFQSVKSTIENLTTWWRTNMGEAFVKANNEFIANNRTDVIQVVVLLSDGMANEPHFDEPPENHTSHSGDTPCPVAQEYARNESKEVSDRGVLIYTIGLGAETYRFDAELLEEIQTNGYYYAPSAEDLRDIYLAIAEDLLFEVRYDFIVITLTLVKAG